MKLSTIIRHDIRAKARLTLSEYVVLAFLDDLKEANLPLNETISEKSIHVSLYNVMTVIELLEQKEFVIAVKESPYQYKTTDKWKALFGFDPDFMTTFLQPVEVAETKIAWATYNRKEVETKLKGMPKKISKAEILDGKIRYFCYLRFLDWDRRAMAAEAFIGPKEHWKSEWWIDSPDYMMEYKRISERINKEFPCELTIESHKPKTMPAPSAMVTENVDPRKKLFR